MNAGTNAATRETVTYLLDGWLRVWQSPNDQVFGQYLQLMHQYGVVKTEAAADRFFRVATEICVEACLASARPAQPSVPEPGTPIEEPSAPDLTFTVVDALSKLFLLLIRLADKEATDLSVRVNLLNRILNVIAKALLDHHENKKRITAAAPTHAQALFDQRPYYRLLSNLVQDMGLPDPKVEVNPQLLPILSTYTTVFLALQPVYVPGFAFAWLQLVSHRSFMGNLMLLPGQKGWPLMHKLLISQLIFLQPFLKTAQLNESIRKIFKGTLRVMLVMLHDFPEFLCDYHLTLCDHIPATCVQMRNLILSAFPRNMRLPDPFTPNLKSETLLPEMSQPPRLFADYATMLLDRQFRPRLESYLQTRQPADLPNAIPQMLLAPNGTGYNIPLVTALVVHSGTVANAHLVASKQPLAQSPAAVMYRHLLSALEPEGRFYLLNAIANQLRYPNNHTHYFSTLLLMLFSESEDELVQEQITRVLLERLIVHRPHPWGLLVTFIELIKDPRYNFWHCPFTRCAPEIERVFESVANSCMGPRANALRQQVQAQKAAADAALAGTG
jgi:CCR4-NOT transcription complex subunit 1